MSAVFDGLSDISAAVGVDLRDALFHGGIDEGILRSQNAKLDFEAYLRVIEFIAKESDRPDFGIISGVTGRRGVFGTISKVIEVAPTLNHLIEILESMIAAFTDAFAFSIHQVGRGELVFELELFVEPSIGSYLYVDCILSGLIKHGLASHPDFEHPTGVFLQRPVPRNLRCYHQVFGRSVKFAHKTNALVFSPEMLRAHLKDSDPGTFHWIKDLIAREMRESRLDRH